MRVPPDGAEARGGAAVARLLEVALPVPTVDARRDHRVAEPERKDYNMVEKWDRSWIHRSYRKQSVQHRK